MLSIPKAQLSLVTIALSVVGCGTVSNILDTTTNTLRGTSNTLRATQNTLNATSNTITDVRQIPNKLSLDPMETLGKPDGEEFELALAEYEPLFSSGVANRTDISVVVDQLVANSLRQRFDSSVKEQDYLDAEIVAAQKIITERANTLTRLKKVVDESLNAPKSFQEAALDNLDDVNFEINTIMPLYAKTIFYLKHSVIEQYRQQRHLRRHLRKLRQRMSELEAQQNQFIQLEELSSGAQEPAPAPAPLVGQK